MKKYEQIISSPLQRTTSCKSTSSKIIPFGHRHSTSSVRLDLTQEFQCCPIAPRLGGSSTLYRLNRTAGSVVSRFLRSILSIPAVFPACRWLSIHTQVSIAPSLGRNVTGTLFGRRRGHVSLAVQDGPSSEPALVVELPVTTAALVREMSSGLLRIELECEKARPPAAPRLRLFREPAWRMYCNGRECGHAQARECTESDWHVLSTVQNVTVGAGVIPVVDDGGKSEGELLYMRARFERVVGNRDSEAFYMLNPDGSGGPELSIFFLRI